MKIEIMNNDKIIQTFGLDKIDWCSIMKFGKVPKNPTWRYIMAGFGRQLIKFLNCPIKGEILLENLYPDPKMMMFIPNGKIRFSLTANAFSENGKKDFLSIVTISQIADE